MREPHGARRLALAGVLLFLAMAAPGGALAAQQVYGTVRDSASQLPLPSTVVLVLDATGRAAARSTTDQQGRFRLTPTAPRTARRTAAAPPRGLRLRVLRMGFRPHEIPLAGPSAGAGVVVSLASFPIVLDEVQVLVPPSCPKRPDRAAAIALLQQVRTALYATVLARAQNSATVKRLLYARRFDGEGGDLSSQTVRTRVTSVTNEPFSAARTASAFDRQGFRQDADGSHSYVGPDAESLVDEGFTESHCFRIMAPDPARPRQVGLRFEPVDRVEEEREGRIDVVGTLWVDTLARVLKDLTFRYVGLDRETSALTPEGRLSFRELSNGVVVIDRWSLRLLGLRAQEIGGEIASASWPDGYGWRAPLGSLRLRVVDGQGRPASASLVRLVDTDHEGTVDANGYVELDDLLPGAYTATIRDPRLAALDIPAAATFRFSAIRDSTIQDRVEIRTADDFVRRRCGQDASAPGKAWVLGRVVTPDGRPVKEARWSLRDEFEAALVEGGKVDEDGLFHWCQVPMGKRISIDVWRDDRRVGEHRVVAEPLTMLRFVLPQ